MKRNVLLLLLVLGALSLHAQKMNMEITLNNDQVKTGIFKLRSVSPITQMPVKIKFISKASVSLQRKVDY